MTTVWAATGTCLNTHQQSQLRLAKRSPLQLAASFRRASPIFRPVPSQREGILTHRMGVRAKSLFQGAERHRMGCASCWQASWMIVLMLTGEHSLCICVPFRLSPQTFSLQNPTCSHRALALCPHLHARIPLVVDLIVARHQIPTPHNSDFSCDCSWHVPRPASCPGRILQLFQFLPCVSMY